MADLTNSVNGDGWSDDVWGDFTIVRPLSFEDEDSLKSSLSNETLERFKSLALGGEVMQLVDALHELGDKPLMQRYITQVEACLKEKGLYDTMYALHQTL